MWCVCVWSGEEREREGGRVLLLWIAGARDAQKSADVLIVMEREGELEVVTNARLLSGGGIDRSTSPSPPPSETAFDGVGDFARRRRRRRQPSSLLALSPLPTKNQSELTAHARARSHSWQRRAPHHCIADPPASSFSLQTTTPRLSKAEDVSALKTTIKRSLLLLVHPVAPHQKQHHHRHPDAASVSPSCARRRREREKRARAPAGGLSLSLLSPLSSPPEIQNSMKKQASLASYYGAAPKRATDKAPAASDKPSDDAGAAQVCA